LLGDGGGGGVVSAPFDDFVSKASAFFHRRDSLVAIITQIEMDCDISKCNGIDKFFAPFGGCILVVFDVFVAVVFELERKI
jgi:hypothetical protein